MQQRRKGGSEREQPWGEGPAKRVEKGGFADIGLVPLNVREKKSETGLLFGEPRTWWAVWRRQEEQREPLGVDREGGGRPLQSIFVRREGRATSGAERIQHSHYH